MPASHGCRPVGHLLGRRERQPGADARRGMDRLRRESCGPLGGQFLWCLPALRARGGWLRAPP
eukprot:11122924-Lingulodinium_polyedra.AAC.1